MNNRFLTLVSLVVGSALILSGCGDNSSFETPNTSGTPTNAGTIAFKNFSLLASETQPKVIDPETNIFTRTEVTMTAYIADRNNQSLTDEHTVFFLSAI